ncbi:MAG TPA: zinc-binding dehydrogenase, partial [Acidimicrobiales bacterium]|nr:zinc-binding dehydrogenase [Acidimicrobiales bacterium]
MKAVRVVQHGRPVDAVDVQEIDQPEPGPGTVRVRVAAGSINYGDIARAYGRLASIMAAPPFTLGMDCCGVVDAAGEGGEEWVGRRVVAITQMAQGGLAEYAIAPTAAVFDAPEALDDAEAAAFLLPFHTTYLALHHRARVQAGETVLVTAGASALGTSAIQLAAAAGARVIAVAGGPEKTALCRELGADVTVDHTAGTDLFEAVMDATDERGAEVVVDLVGGDGTEKLWTCVAYDGRFVPVGFNDDLESGMTGRPLRKVSMGNFSVVGVLLSYAPPSRLMRQFGVVTNPPEVGAAVHASLCRLIDRGAIRPYVGRRIGPDDVAAALADHEARR